MKFFISYDADWESRVESVVSELSDRGIRTFFEGRFYGGGIDCVSVILMCRDPSHGFKQRKRYSKKDRVFHMDIMLDLERMRLASPQERKHEVAGRICEEVPEALLKQRIPEFEKDQFIEDLQGFLRGLQW